MIKYEVKCIDCSFTFDSWFASSREFEKLKKSKYLNCIKCNSTNVDKSLMSPNLSNTKKTINIKDNKQFQSFKKKMKNYQKFIKENFEYVGENFTYEARSLHYKNKKNKKGIYGNASLDDIKELKEEGIETEMIPWINEKDN